jgi:hypothetical protein
MLRACVLGQKSVVGWIFIQQQLPRKFENGTVLGIIWTTMPHTAQLNGARRESYIWSRYYCWGRSNGTSYQRKLKSHKVAPRELCKQEALTFTVWGWRPRILKGFTNEGREEIWSERKVATSLYQTIPNSWEVWKGGIQVGVTTIIERSSWHLPRISAKEVFEGTRGCCIAGSGTT